jgi:hypothetical protein
VAANVTERIPVDENFGNLIFRGVLEEINLPESVSLWPQAPGWKFLSIVVFVIASYYIYQFVKRWWENRYRRAAIFQLSELESSGNTPESLNRLAFLIKATALQIYPRTEIASLFGASWFAYLNEKSGEHGFDHRCIELLGSVQYQKSASELSESEFEHMVLKTRHWLKYHPLPDSDHQLQLGECTDV